MPHQDHSILRLNQQGQNWLAPAACLLALAFPFIAYWRLIIPWAGYAIGNDFEILYYNYRVYLLDYLSNGHLPLWSPTEACGFPFASNPFAAIFYPLNFPLALLYGVLGGYSKLDHQIFTILGLGLFSMGSVVWLSGSLQLPRTASLLGATLAAINFKLAEALRFPNAIHAIAWYPWILACITSIFRQAPNNRIRYHLGLCGALICLITAGYPYVAYYGIFIFTPYTILCGLAAYSRGVRVPKIAKQLSFLLLAVGITLLIVSPYLSQMWSTLQQTTDRAGTSFDFSTSHKFTWNDTLASLFFPPAAQTEGWIYPGVLGLALTMYYFVFAGTFDTDRQREWWQSRLLKFTLLLWYLFICAITHSADSSLFGFLWDTLPGFSSMRVWGRLQIVLVPLLAFTSAAGFTELMARIKESGGNRADPKVSALLASFGSIYCVIGLVQVALYFEPRHVYWIKFHSSFTGSELAFIVLGACGACAVLIALHLFCHSRTQNFRLLALFIAGLAAIELTPWICGIWGIPASETDSHHEILNLPTRIDQGFAKPRQPCFGLSLGSAFCYQPWDNWYYNRYTSFLQKWGEQDRISRDTLIGLRGGGKLFFTYDLASANPALVLKDSQAWSGNIRVIRYTGDALEFEVESKVLGYILAIDNWDQNWRAQVNGIEVPCELALETFKAVKIQPGKSFVKLWYEPFWR